MENVTLLTVVNAAEKPVAKPKSRTMSNRRSTMAQSKASSPSEPSLQVKFISAGLAASFADLVTFPLDTAKVRLQIQGEAVLTGSGLNAAAGAVSKQYKGVIGTVCTIARQEGPKALYNGIVPGLQRQMCFASVRIGLYDSVKQAYTKQAQALGMKDGGITVRLLAGCTTGGLAVLSAQPTDVVKVRMQAEKGGGPKRYTGVMNAYSTIARQEGLRGLWKGMTPNIARNCVVNCAELVSYDLIKTKILQLQLLSDNLPCHFVSAFGAGFFTTCVGSPVDVVKTRFMNSAQGTYKGVIDCAVTMAKQEGATAFYKGFMPSFMRLASWNVVMFVGYEQLKRRLSSDIPAPLPSIEIKPSTQRYM